MESVKNLKALEIVAKDLQKTHLYHEIVTALNNLVLDPKVSAEELEKKIKVVLESSGHKQNLRNIVYHYMLKNSQAMDGSRQIREPLDFIQKAQTTWEKRIFKSLNSMCNELGIALSRKRPVSEQKDMEAKWTELGSEEMDLSRFRPVYSPKDFLDVLVSLRNPNLSNSEQGAATLWGDIKIPLKVNNLQNLRSEFEELTSNISQVEVDNYSSFDTEHCVTFLHERSVLGEKVLQTNHSPLSREYAKRGCLQSQRANLWCQILGISIHNEDRLKFEHLKSCVFRHDLMIDKLIFKDIRLTAANDDQYFVFEDLLYQILLVFSRDVSIVEHFRYSSATPPKGFLRGRSGQEEGLVVYPPSGIIPYHGFTMYVTPLCYLYEDPVTLYGVFKELFCRYLCCLHTVSSHPQGILCLCLQFEMLLHEADPQLMYHCAHHDIHPLKIAQKWIMRMFAGYLSVDQVLLLWDRILAFDSLELLPVLAVAIMSFRKSILLTAENQVTLEAMLADVSTIKVVPLLQWLLTRSV